MELPPLGLGDLRGQLIRLEETIIFALIERAQFARNATVYVPGASAVFGEGAQPSSMIEGSSMSFLDYMLRETERLHSLVRRYLSADEHPFFANELPPPILPTLHASAKIKPNAININRKIKSVYENSILAQMPLTGEDGHLGASAVCDISALQALSKRIHYGKFIAEAKFQANRDEYSAMIRARDSEGLMNALTKPEVEVQVLERVRLKASTYGQDPQASAAPGAAEEYKLAPDAIMALYRDWVMPLTKEVQVAYLLQRLAPSTVALVVSRGGNIGASDTAGSFDVMPDAHVQRSLECAARKGGDGYRYRGYDSAEAVINAVKSSAADAGVVHLESSDLGVHRATQRLLIDSGLFIRDEIWRDVRCAVARRGDVAWPPAPPFNAATLRCQVFGTARVLARCSAWLRATLPIDVQCERVEVDSDAEALAAVGDDVREGGAATRIAVISVVADAAPTALGSARFPALDMELVAGCRARERLVVLSKSFGMRSAFDQTALSFDLDGSHPGDLSRALRAFQTHGIDLDQIQSLSLAGTLPESSGSYRFYVELKGHASDPHITRALVDLRDMVGADSVRLLGSFMRNGSGGRNGGDGGATPGGVAASAAESGAPGALAGTATATALRAAWGADRVWHFLGPRATFTHAATSALIARYARAEGDTPSLNACAKIGAVFDAVVDGGDSGVASSCCGVVPIENSTAGAVLETIDLLHQHAGSLVIVAEHLLPIEHCLFSHAPSAAAVVEVISKDQAIAQSSGWLDTNAPAAKRVGCASTALAVQRAASANAAEGIGAIGAAIAGEVHGVPMLQRGIQDRCDNATRFVVLGATNGALAAAATSARCGPRRVAASFSLARHLLSAVAVVVSALERAGLDVVMLVSRPAPSAAWGTRFYAEARFADGAGLALVQARLRDDLVGEGVCSALSWLGDWVEGTNTF